MHNKEKFFNSFRGLNMRFSRFYAGLLEDEKLTIQQFTLLNMLHMSGRMPMTAASNALHITKPAVTNLVDGLEEQKMIRRNQDPEDRRVYLLELLPKGRAKIEKTQKHIFELMLKALKGFSAKEQDTVNRFHDAMSCTLEGYFKQ